MFVLLMSGKIVLFTFTAGANAIELMSDCFLKAQISTYYNIKYVYMTQTTANHITLKNKTKQYNFFFNVLH